MMVHPAFRPDRKTAGVCEKSVWLVARKLAARVEVAATVDDLRTFDRQLCAFRPDLVFNLLEEFRGQAVYDFHLVSYLEALGIPFTGCNPRGLILTRNKLQLAAWLKGRNVRTPEGWLVSNETRATLEAQLKKTPLFIKLNREDASLGIRQSNCVRTPGQLQKTLARLRRDFPGEILAQEFIAGHDVSVSVWGNRKVSAFAPRRLNVSGGTQRVSSERLKFSSKQQRSWAVRSVPYRDVQALSLTQEAALLFNELDLSGYARFDYRISEQGQAYLLDVNANPNLARNEDFALSAGTVHLSYQDVICEIVHLGLNYRPRI
jgi:D-alanine-D-alanine ligase